MTDIAFYVCQILGYIVIHFLNKRSRFIAFLNYSHHDSYSNIESYLHIDKWFRGFLNTVQDKQYFHIHLKKAIQSGDRNTLLDLFELSEKIQKMRDQDEKIGDYILELQYFIHNLGNTKDWGHQGKHKLNTLRLYALILRRRQDELSEMIAHAHLIFLDLLYQKNRCVILNTELIGPISQKDISQLKDGINLLQTQLSDYEFF